MAEGERSREVPAHHPYLIDHPPRHYHRIPISPSADARDLAALQHRDRDRDMQSILFDNQRLAATHLALKQELSLAQHDLQNLSAAAADIKAQRDAQVRDVYERCLKMEAEVRSIQAMNAELSDVREDTQKLSKAKQELTKEVQTIDSDLDRARSQLQQLPAVQAEIETTHQELQRGRAAIEYEKKTRASNLEHSKAMETNMVMMAREIEKLRAELVNYEKRAMAAAANTNAGYGVNPAVMGYGANPGSYGIAAMHHQGQGSLAEHHGAGALSSSNGPYGIMQQPNVHR